MTDTHRAVSLMRKLAGAYGVDPTKVGVVGFSAGGHLAATVSVMPTNDPAERPDFSALVYPAVAPSDANREWLESTFFHRPMTDEELSDWNLVGRIDESTPPTLLIHAYDDNVVPISESLIWAGGNDRGRRRCGGALLRAGRPRFRPGQIRGRHRPMALVFWPIGCVGSNRYQGVTRPPGCRIPPSAPMIQKNSALTGPQFPSASFARTKMVCRPASNPEVSRSKCHGLHARVVRAVARQHLPRPAWLGVPGRTIDKDPDCDDILDRFAPIDSLVSGVAGTSRDLERLSAIDPHPVGSSRVGHVGAGRSLIWGPSDLGRIAQHLEIVGQDSGLERSQSWKKVVPSSMR